MWKWSPSGYYREQLWVFSVGEFYLEAAFIHADGFMGYENALTYLMQDMTVLQNVHYLSGRRRRKLGWNQSLKLLWWKMNYTDHL